MIKREMAALETLFRYPSAAYFRGFGTHVVDSYSANAAWRHGGRLIWDHYCVEGLYQVVED